MCGDRDTQSGDERESSRQQKAEKARNTDHQGESAETGSPGSIPASCSGAGGLGAAPAWPPPLLSIIPSYKDLTQSHRLHPLIQAHAFEHLQRARASAQETLPHLPHFQLPTSLSLTLAPLLAPGERFQLPTP